MIDFIQNRTKLSRLRQIIIRFPLIWWVYKKVNLIIFYSQFILSFLFKKNNLLNFGNYNIPSLKNPTSQLCTSNQFFEESYNYWISKLNSAKKFSRKQWEFIFIAQVLKNNNKLTPNSRGLGFGCGKEPLPALFAEYGVESLATDLSVEESKELGWIQTNQHASKLLDLYETSSFKIDYDDFKNKVSFEFLNMNKIPEKYFGNYDFVWSSCSLEHLGSISHGIDFILNSLKCLKPGGIAIHTTEFNVSSDQQTLNEKDCCIFRKKDFDYLEKNIPNGFELKKINYNLGENRIDSYVDYPPFNINPHLKVKIRNFNSTSIGIIIVAT